MSHEMVFAGKLDVTLGTFEGLWICGVGNHVSFQMRVSFEGFVADFAEEVGNIVVRFSNVAA